MIHAKFQDHRAISSVEEYFEGPYFDDHLWSCDLDQKFK